MVQTVVKYFETDQFANRVFFAPQRKVVKSNSSYSIFSSDLLLQSRTEHVGIFSLQDENEAYAADL